MKANGDIVRPSLSLIKSPLVTRPASVFKLLHFFPPVLVGKPKTSDLPKAEASVLNPPPGARNSTSLSHWLSGRSLEQAKASVFHAGHSPSETRGLLSARPKLDLGIKQPAFDERGCVQYPGEITRLGIVTWSDSGKELRQLEEQR